MIILCDVAESSDMVVTLSNGVDFSIVVNVLTSEFSCDVVGNLVSFDVYEMPCGVVLIISVISAVRVVVAISGGLIL